MFAMKHPVLTVKDIDSRYEEISDEGSREREEDSAVERGSGPGSGSDWKSELHRHVQYIPAVQLSLSIS